MNKFEDLQIRALFNCKEGKITSVHLEPSVSGFEWEVKGDASMAGPVSAWLEEYLQKREPKKALPVDLSSMPPFTRRILHLLQKVPFGKALSYADLATIAGGRRLARAAGGALGRNPCLLILPCHRILTSQMQIGGFSAGLELKKRLLAFEDISFGT